MLTCCRVGGVNIAVHGYTRVSTAEQAAGFVGLIVAIGNWVIEDACRQSRQWREKGLRMRVAINLSAHQMRQDDIVERITGALQAHRIHPSLLTCEITESAAMEDTKTTQSANWARISRSTTSAPATRAWPT